MVARLDPCLSFFKVVYIRAYDIERNTMRKIKFRAIDFRVGRLWDVTSINFKDQIVGIMDDDGNTWEYELNDEIALVQYTGLKDKYGEEIYEGDILELRANPFYRKRDLFQVVFKDGGFRDEWNNYIGQYLPPDIRNKQGGRVRLNEACEVVGNIYENKELLDE